MCSVVTNLVTSLEFQPIRCATMLFPCGWKRNCYIATQFILLTSTAESSATRGYVVAPKRSGQSEAWAGRNVKRTRKKPSFVPSSWFNWCNSIPKRVIIISSDYFRVFYLTLVHFNYFFLWRTSFIFTLMSISDGLDPYFFCRKMETTRSMEEEMDGELFISRQNGLFPRKDNMIKVLFPICTLIWRLNNYVSRQGKV